MTRTTLATAGVVAMLASTAAAAPVENRVTMLVRPTTQGALQPVRLSGTISEAKADEDITIQAKDCGQPFFRAVAAAHTDKDGTWTTQFGSPISTVLRADWKDAVSAPVPLRVQADVRLQPDPPGPHALEVIVVAKYQFWRKKTIIQLRDRRLGRWRNAKTVVLEKSGAAPGSLFVWSSAKFTLKVPKGTTLRAVFPRTQAKPCYLGGYSNNLRR